MTPPHGFSILIWHRHSCQENAISYKRVGNKVSKLFPSEHQRVDTYYITHEKKSCVVHSSLVCNTFNLYN